MLNADTGTSSLLMVDPADTGPRVSTRGIGRVMAHVQELSAFTPACDHALAAIELGRAGFTDLISAIESDTGLTVAVLCRAQRLTVRRAIANIPEAVTKLGMEEIRAVIDEVRRRRSRGAPPRRR